MDALANPRIGWVKVDNVGKKHGQCNQGYYFPNNRMDLRCTRFCDFSF